MGILFYDLYTLEFNHAPTVGSDLTPKHLPSVEIDLSDQKNLALLFNQKVIYYNIINISITILYYDKSLGTEIYSSFKILARAHVRTSLFVIFYN